MQKFPALQNVPVPEDTLRALSKDLGTVVPANQEDVPDDVVNQIATTLNSLVETASLINISPGHRAAACNPLCSILERCQVSSDERIKNLVWTENIWSRLFAVFLERSELAKAKSVRQVLLLLTSVVQRSSHSRSAQETRSQCLENVLLILFGEGDHLKVKPALQALAHFIQKELFQVSEIIQGCQRWHHIQASSTENATQSFLVCIMGWVSHQDTAPAAGNLISKYLKHGRLQHFEEIISKDPSNPLAVWVTPLEKSIRKNPDSIQNFRSHLFPELFKPVISDYLEFLVYLRLDDHVALKVGTDGPSSDSDDLQALILFSALQSGKEIGLVKEVAVKDPEHHKFEISEGAIAIPDLLLERLLSHERPETRLAALSLLVNSAAITRPFTNGALNAFNRNFGHLHADTDANFRGELLSLALQLFDRLRAATSTLSKASKKRKMTHEPEDQSMEIDRRAQSGLMESHFEFIRCYLRFLEDELRPTASYQRHISALKALTIAAKSGLDPNIPAKWYSKQALGEIKWPSHMQILNASLVRALYDLMMDPFDDVRHAAAALLKMGSESTSAGKPDENSADKLIELNFGQFQKRAENIMLRSGRADHSDGVARAYDLIFEKRAPESRNPENSVSLAPLDSDWSRTQRGIVEHLMRMLESTILMASRDLSAAVSEYPMHGLLSGLRYIFDQARFYSAMNDMDEAEIATWRSFHQRLFRSLHSIWACVRDILCNDAPEGHVPDDMEEEPDLTTKDILSYSWRALKEASTLLRVVVAKAPFNLSNGTIILETSDFEDLGRLCFLQLAELRHRGAFSTVAQTFAACCLRCSRSSDPSIRRLLDQWYEETLSFVRNKASMITRRSAGLPSLITGILVANPDGPLFKRVMNDLIAEATMEGQDSNIEGSHLPQVHALNCLKDIFIHTKLGQASEVYMAEGLSLAASRLESNVWAIRNCGLMLFRALIDRLLGSGTTQVWKESDRLKVSRLSYESYPSLLPIIVKLLTPTRRGSFASGVALEGVFPALQILQRALPPASRRAEIRQLVLNLTHSSHWHVRDMAARTLATLLDQTESLEWVLFLLESPFPGQNALHGMLLSVKYITRKYFENASGYTKNTLDLLSFALSEKYEELFEGNRCRLTKAAYVDVLNLLGIQSVTKGFPMPYYFDDHSAQLFNEQDKAELVSRSNGTALLQRALALYRVLSPLLRALTQEPNTFSFRILDRNLGLTLSTLIDQDTDTCSITLETLSNLLSPIIASTTIEFQALVLHSICYLEHRELNSSRKAQVASAMRQTIANLLDAGTPASALRTHSSPDPPFGSLDINEPSPFEHGLVESKGVRTSPSLVENTLRLRGPLLDLQIQTASTIAPSLITSLNQFIIQLHRSLHETNPFPTRFAAISSLASLTHIWTHHQRTSDPSFASAILRFSLVTYDALNDDDDEIRDLAAKVVPRIIGGDRFPPGAKTVVPLVASALLVEYLAREYGDELFCRAGVERMLCSESGRPLDGAPAPMEKSVRELLSEARKESTALFAQEKQNLFVDPVREAGVWADALKRLEADKVPWDLKKRLGVWVVEGLEVLKETMIGERDGALGWTSKAETFALGMRVVEAVGVAVSWGVEVEKCRVLLDELGVAGQKGDVNGVWLERIAEVALLAGEERMALG